MAIYSRNYASGYKAGKSDKGRGLPMIIVGDVVPGWEQGYWDGYFHQEFRPDRRQVVRRQADQPVRVWRWVKRQITLLIEEIRAAGKR